MTEGEKPLPHHGGKLDAASNSLPFPSMLLLRKRPFELDQEAKAAEADKLKKRGSAIMDRVKGFLPAMKSSEEELQRRMDTVQNPEQLDIENVEEGETAVEFNLGLFEYSSSDSEDLDAESDVTESSSVSNISDDEERPAKEKIVESSDIQPPPT